MRSAFHVNAPILLAGLKGLGPVPLVCRVMFRPSLKIGRSSAKPTLIRLVHDKLPGVGYMSLQSCGFSHCSIVMTGSTPLVPPISSLARPRRHRCVPFFEPLRRGCWTRAASRCPPAGPESLSCWVNTTPAGQPPCHPVQ